MADTKISALTSVSTPLGGTEELAIVQSGTTKKGTANDLAGRAEVRAQHSCRAYNSAVIAVTTSTWTSMTLDTEVFDYGSVHSTVSNTSRFTAAVAGIYRISAVATFAANATGERRLRIAKNGAALAGAPFVALGAQTGIVMRFTITGLASLAATDYLEIQAWQDSGGNLNVTPTSVDFELVHRT